jgi:TonB family protein
MTEYWKQWEGQVIADAFPLQQYLGGDGDHAVFLTEYGQPASQKAAIKIVLGTTEDGELQIQRWSHAAKLSHRHLVRILTVGRWQAGNIPLVYLVMEYADESLAQVIPVRPLTAEETRQMLEPAISVLAYIHSQGFVHGHVRPGNIMAVGECLKISSAGLCRTGECSPAIRDAYSAPEGFASPAGDVWSLGMTLVEALTQKLPDNSPTGVDVPETIPQPFLEIARECLRADPTTRSTFADISAHLSARLRPSARLQPTVNPARRPVLKWSYALAAATGLVIAAVVIAPKLIDRQEPVAATAPAQVPQTAPAQPAPAPQPAPKVQAAPPPATHRDEVLQRVLPEVPGQALRTIQGRVKVSVRVDVDPSGKVVGAKLDSAGPSKYFAQFALQAARRWKFAPATGGSDRLREWTLQFEFSRTGTKVVPVRRGS